MEIVAALLLSVVLFMHAWQLFERSDPKTTGIVAALGAIALTAIVALKPLEMHDNYAGFAAMIMVWAIYAALVAGVGLWGFDPRGLGLFCAYGVVAEIGQVVSSIYAFELVGLICGLVQAVAFVMLFLHYGIPLINLKKATAWVLVIVGPIHGLLAFLMAMGVFG